MLDTAVVHQGVEATAIRVTQAFDDVRNPRFSWEPRMLPQNGAFSRMKAKDRFSEGLWLANNGRFFLVSAGKDEWFDSFDLLTDRLRLH